MIQKIKKQWETFNAQKETADTAFASLRIMILLGVVGWALFSDSSKDTIELVKGLTFIFLAYSIIIYLFLLFLPDKKNTAYLFFLICDFLFTAALVQSTGGFKSPFSNGYYLMTALYSFYFGTISGFMIASAATVLYLASGNGAHTEMYWTDLSVRIAFLYVLALPLGMLSQKLRNDNYEIESLNRTLERNIEELKHIHGRLIQVEKMSQLGRLTADVAHEIRNPLTSIGGFARRLEKKLSQIKNEKECFQNVMREKQYAEIIVSEVNMLERILRDVLTFSREVKYNMEYLKINDIMKEAVRSFVDIGQEQSIRIEEKLTPSLPEIFIDRDQIRLAANNLVSNAIDSMHDGGVIQVKTYSDELHAVHYVVAEVADTGQGIPSDKLNTIFEPFYSSKQIGAGTGLGLSICKKIIDEHNGLIKVDSELNRGTSFKFLFPYVSEEEAQKTKCWEFHKCGVERSENAALLACPAYPNYGRICWAVAGTFCSTKVSGAIARKLGDCNKCEFYKRVVVSRDL